MTSLKSAARPKTSAPRSSPSKMTDAEWELRVDLAACYRLVDHYGMCDMHLNHISARVPGDHEHFLINPFGMMYEEITASSLIKIDLDGKVIANSNPEYGVNLPGYVIHSAIHMGRKDLHCVMHTHTVAGMAVSALDCGLLPLNQGVMRFYNHIAYHDFEGIARDEDEPSRQAITHYRVKERFSRNALLEVELDTGRQHQIRLHLRALGHPIVGDGVYGSKERPAGSRPLLHASKLAFPHPLTAQPVDCESNPPRDFADILKRLRTGSRR